MRFVAVAVLTLITLGTWVRNQLASLYSEGQDLSQGIWSGASVTWWVYSCYCSEVTSV